MSDNRSEFLDRAAALRDAFDRSFAEPLPLEPPPLDELLAIRVGSAPYALRIAELAGLYADRKITPLPSRVPGLLGIAGFRGAIVPVYDLSVLLGERAGAAARWLAMAREMPVGFAFASQEGQFRVGREAIVQHESDDTSRRHIREFARMPVLVRPIVDLSSVIEMVRRQVPAALNTEDR